MTRLDPGTLQPKPCPLCDSANVRWRRPRPHEYVATWMRHALDLTLAGTSQAGRYGRNRRSVREVRDDVRRSRLELRTGLKTPEYYWRCPDCKHKGYVLNGKAMHTS